MKEYIKPQIEMITLEVSYSILFDISVPGGIG